MQEKAIIFNIQRFSINDGPGIRTAIFFKGCPLKCKWCSNPESQSKKPEILWEKELCSACSKCKKICPNNAINIFDEEIYVDNNLCIGCNTCVNSCSSKALNLFGAYYSLDDVFNTCMKDYDFYIESNGGITISGGEAMLHSDFIIDLLKLFNKEGIHTAIETTAFSSQSIFIKVLNFIDLVLFDVKHYDREKHFEGTGVFNDIIIENLKSCVKLKKDIITRIPVIPSYNSSLADAQAFSDLFKAIGIYKVQLLPFHQYGEKKYEMMHKHYEFNLLPQLHIKDLQSYQNIFINNGIDCFF